MLLRYAKKNLWMSSNKKRKQPSAHVVKLLIDTRERASGESGSRRRIYETLASKLGADSVELSTMDVGDYAFSVDGAVVILVERKTLNDLASSIRASSKKSGNHFREQKRRMLEQPDDDPQRPCSREYLVEGRMAMFEERPPGYTRNILMSAIVNCQRRDDLPVVRTESLEETIDWLCKTFDKLCEYGYNGAKRTKTVAGQPSSTDHAVGGTSDYVDTLKRSKSRITTPHECFVQQLQIIPKVSMHLAKSLALRFGSMRGFVQWLEQHAFDATCLDGFRYEISKQHLGAESTFRKLGKNSPISRNIVQYLQDQ